jgi:hypothetical protein
MVRSQPEKENQSNLSNPATNSSIDINDPEYWKKIIPAHLVEEHESKHKQVSQ